MFLSYIDVSLSLSFFLSLSLKSIKTYPQVRIQERIKDKTQRTGTESSQKLKYIFVIIGHRKQALCYVLTIDHPIPCNPSKNL